MLLLETMLGQATDAATSAVSNFAFDWRILALGIGLIIATILVIMFVKQVIINSVLGLICWAIATFVFQIKMNLVISLIVSIIFGPAGFGMLLLLNFLGIQIS
jgi:hypothetical protein